MLFFHGMWDGKSFKTWLSLVMVTNERPRGNKKLAIWSSNSVYKNVFKTHSTKCVNRLKNVKFKLFIFFSDEEISTRVDTRPGLRFIELHILGVFIKRFQKC